MTCFGPDISSYQAGLVLARLADADFVIAKATEGSTWTDPDFGTFRAQTVALRRLFIWYHFLSGAAAAAQAEHTFAVVDSTVLPGMLDAEPTNTFRPTLAQIYAYIDAAHAAGLNLRLCYLPRWYWEELGSPDLSGLENRGVHLVSSQYLGGTGNPERLYPGDGAAGWEEYGGQVPLIYQYTDRASDGGQTIDDNAFRGTAAELAAKLAPQTAPEPTTTPSEDDDMPAFATGTIEPGEGAVTVVLPPPANYGSAGWGNVWFSLGCDFGDVHVRVAAWVHGKGWTVVEDFLVPQYGDRVGPFGGPLPQATQKISIKRLAAGADKPLAYLIEAAHK